VTDPEAPAAVAIVGSGAVAQAMGRVMYVAGARVVAVASRSRRRAADAARFIGPSVRPAAIDEVPAAASHVLIAVSDHAVSDVARLLSAAGLRQGIAVHTCGAMGPAALAPLGGGVACGVIHPLQTIREPERAIDDLVGAYFMVCGDPLATDWARTIAASVDGKVLEIESARAACYHAGAVMASNALVASLDAAVRLMGLAGIDAARALPALTPLARASVDNALAQGPARALTGPVVRGDAATIASHVSAIHEAPPSVRELYGAVARHLITVARSRGLSDASADAIEKALR